MKVFVGPLKTWGFFLLFSGLLSGVGIAADLSQLEEKTKIQLRKQFPQLEQNPNSKAELDQVIRWLVQHENFESASFSYDENLQQYKIKTGVTQRINSIQMLGVNQLAESEVRGVLGAVEKSTFNQEFFLEGAERIRLHYRDLGYYSTIVEVEFRKAKGLNTDVILKINEGFRTNVNFLVFQSGNKKLNTQLEKKTRSYLRQPYNPATLNEIKKELRTYFSENRYFKAEVTEPVVEISADEKHATLKFTIKNPEDYTVIADDEESNDVHQSAIKAIGIKNFVSTNPNIPQEIASRVKNYLISQGYAKAEVRYEEDDNYAYEKKIRLKINEGRRIKIEKIEVSGKLSREPDYYQNFILRNSSPVFAKKYYVKDDLENGLKNLVIDRQNNGFLKASKVSHRAIYNREGDSIAIFVNFDEGPLTQIQRIIFEGNTSIDEKELLQLLNLQQLEPLRLFKLEEALTRIKQFYLDSGYLEMTISNEKQDLVQYNEDNTLAQIHIKIHEGPKVIVGSIVIEGNTITKDFVIISEIDFAVGETLTPTKIEESITRLQRLGIFSAVNIRTLEEKTNLSKRTILISVADRDPGLFNAGLGVTNELRTTIRGFVGLAYRNLFGGAHVVSTRLDGNYNTTDIQLPEYKFSIGYLYPYLFGTKLKFRTNYTRAKYFSNFNNPLVTTNTEQGTLTFEQDITTHFLLSYDIWTKAKYEDYTEKASGSSAFYNQLEIGSTAISAEFDYRDHPFNPRRGFLARLSAEYGSPFYQSSSFITYERNIGSLSGYLPLGENFTLATSLRGGHIMHLNASPGSYTPYDKKGFILGGQTTIRGFTPPESFPNSADLNAVLYQLRTQASMVLIKTELRFPIWNDIGGAIFYDGGMVSIPTFDLPYRHSAGVSAKLNTPVGPINLEIGWKLNIQNGRNEGPFAVHLSVGTF